MTEYFTEALILEKNDFNEFDSLVILYTRDLGKISAKAKSLRKITSKLSAHLEPLNFSNVRLVEKKGCNIVEALTIDKQSRLRASEEVLADFLDITRFIKEMTFEFHPDYQLWFAVKKIMSLGAAKKIEKKSAYRLLLKILGFDPQYSYCDLCHKKESFGFFIKDHIFLCQNCSFQAPKDQLILI